MANGTQYLETDEDEQDRRVPDEEVMIGDTYRGRQVAGVGADRDWDTIREGINQFWDTQGETGEQHIEQQLQNRLGQIQTSGQVQETQDRFARARAGNTGGTRRSTQQGLLKRALSLQAGEATMQAQGAQSQNRMQTEAGRFEDLASTFHDPFEQAATNSILQGVGVDAQQIQAQTQTRINLNEVYRRYQQQVGQFIGSSIRNAGDAYYNSYNVRR